MLLLGLLEVPTWIILTLVITVLLYLYGTRNFNAYKDSGLKGPKPLPFIGTLHHFLLYGFSMPTEEMARKASEDLGKTFVIFIWTEPCVLSVDVEFITQVCIKQFPNFINRQENILLSKGLFTVRDEQWKNQRSIISPTFTGGKLRLMCPEIHRCVKQFIAQVIGKKGPFEVRKLASHFTMDVIASTAFGLRVNSQEDKGNAFTKNITKVANSFTRVTPLMLLSGSFPAFGRFLGKLGIHMVDQSAWKFFEKVLEETMNQRETGNKKRSDFLQLMVNAETDTKDKEDASKLEGQRTENIAKGISHDEIIANAIGFFTAGSDVVSAGLTYLLYNLAIYPECQKKVIEEIDIHVGDKSELDYDTMNKLSYLDQCLQESLRMYPPIAATERQSKNDVEVCGIKLKKGVRIMFNVLGVHFHPEYWPEPEKFDPERFTLEAKAGRPAVAWMPFGVGPRNCIGMRLALLQMKMPVAGLLRTHRVVTCDKTEIPVKMEKYQFLKAVNGVWLAVNKR